MKTVEMIGNKFNKLFVDGLSEGSNTYVDVTCECGNRYSANASDIRRGKVTQCKKCSNKKLEKDVNIGDKFWLLTVIEDCGYIKNGSKKRRTVKCKCECGNTICVILEHLRSGHTKSCGCLRKESSKHRSDYIIGNTYGKLYVESFAFTKNGASYFNCICSCGNRCTVASCHLKSGATISCGCIKSKLERETGICLNKRNITFSKEYTFNDLKSSNGGRLKFDFAIYNENNILLLLIECQGIQHVDSHNDFGKLQREETDELKKNYCKKHNIPLYEIWYYENVEERVKEILEDFNYL